MSGDQSNTLIVKRWLEDGFNKRNLDLFLGLLADDFVHHGLGLNLEAFKASRQELFPQLPATALVTIEDSLCEGDKVAIRLTYREPDHEPQTELLLFHLHEGRITDIWNCFMH